MVAFCKEQTALYNSSTPLQYLFLTQKKKETISPASFQILTLKFISQHQLAIWFLTNTVAIFPIRKQNDITTIVIILVNIY